MARTLWSKLQTWDDDDVLARPVDIPSGPLCLTELSDRPFTPSASPSPGEPIAEETREVGREPTPLVETRPLHIPFVTNEFRIQPASSSQAGKKRPRDWNEGNGRRSKKRMRV